MCMSVLLLWSRGYYVHWKYWSVFTKKTSIINVICIGMNTRSTVNSSPNDMIHQRHQYAGKQVTSTAVTCKQTYNLVTRPIISIYTFKGHYILVLVYNFFHLLYVFSLCFDGEVQYPRYFLIAETVYDRRNICTAHFLGVTLQFSL